MTDANDPLKDMYDTIYYMNEALYKYNIYYTKDMYEEVKRKYYQKREELMIDDFEAIIKEIEKWSSWDDKAFNGYYNDRGLHDLKEDERWDEE